MKKILAIMMAGIMMLAVTGCGGESARSDSIDIDLTALSSTMIYSEVSNMMTTPEDFIGKTVKMTGTMAVYYDEENDVYYEACVIDDATACCQQGLEFQLKGNPDYPDGYPEVDSEITVVGTFNTYDDNGVTYARLENAEIL